MRPTVTLDMTQWKAAANQLHQTSSRTLVDFTNGQALKVVSLALRNTRAADARRIERELGAVGPRAVSFRTITRGKRKGQTRTVLGDYTLVGEDTLGHRILIARRIKTGKWGVEGRSISDKVKNLIRARVASTNFIRAGWIPALDRLWSVVRQRPSRVSNIRHGARARGQRKGSATPAAFSLRSVIVATVENRAMRTVPKAPSGRGNAYRTAIQGLQQAMNEATVDMLAELARRLNPDLKRVSAK